MTPAAFRTPTLIIRGDRDVFADKELAKAIARARETVVMRPRTGCRTKSERASWRKRVGSSRLAPRHDRGSTPGPRSLGAAIPAREDQQIAAMLMWVLGHLLSLVAISVAFLG